MSNNKLSKITLEKQLNKEFAFYLEKVNECLTFGISHPSCKILVQDKDSSIEIPSIGKSIGTYLIEDSNHLLFANWVFDLPVRERSYIKEFLLVKEAFRCCLSEKLGVDYQTNDLVEIALFLIATLWLINNKDTTISHPQIMSIRRRFAFTDNELFRCTTWDSNILLCYRFDITPSLLFNELVKSIIWGTSEKKTFAEVVMKFSSWLKDILSERDVFLLPHQLSECEYKTTIILHQLGQVNGTPKNIAKKLNVSHDTIYTVFKELYDKHNLFWQVQRNFMSLNLYPHYFKVVLADKKHSSKLLDKLQKTDYIKDIFINPSKKIIVGYMYCPLVIQNQLICYFEKLEKKGIIKDFYVQQLKRKRLFSTITQIKIEPTEENYKMLLQDPTIFSCETLLLNDEVFDIENPPTRKRKISIDENLLSFFSIFNARYLIKAHYMFYPLQELFVSCKKNGIDPNNSVTWKDYINQLEIRLRRLKLIGYYLNLHSIDTYGHALYFELCIVPSNPKVELLVDQLKNLLVLIHLELQDRVIIAFPKTGLSHPARKIIENQIKELGFNYFVYSLITVKGFKRYIPFHKLYDYEKKRWNI